jgi:outer membrane protein assembly factor BamA
MRTDGPSGPRGLAIPAGMLAGALAGGGLIFPPGLAGGLAAQDLRVAAVEIRGIEDVEPAVRLSRRLQLRPGGPYTTERVDATEQLIRLAVAQSGHPYAEIEVSASVDHVSGTAIVVFHVDPGPVARFGDIDIQAPHPFREEDIRARVVFEPGERFRPSAVERTRQAIGALPGVRDVVVELPGLERGAPVLPAVVRVARPDRMADVGARATISSSQCLEVAGAWRHRHFLGGPRLFTIAGGFSNLFAGLADGGFPCPGAGEGAYAQPNYFLTTELLPTPVAFRARPAILNCRTAELQNCRTAELQN